MIATCPACHTRYRVAPEKIGPQDAARIRCQKCDTVFKVAAPKPAAEPEPEIVARAIVAEAHAPTGKAMRALLLTRGIEAELFEDGAAALLALHRKRPDLAILGGHLPGIAAPAITEILRRNADLQDVPLIRVAPRDEPGPQAEFDADQLIEPGDLPDGLGGLLDDLGVGHKGGAARKRKAAAPSPQPPKPAPAPKAKASPPPRPAPSDDPEVKAAERLARIVISDIVLYNEEKFAQAAVEGNVAEALAPELEEAGAMFKSRVSEKLRQQRNFLVEELERRAARKREQG